MLQEQVSFPAWQFDFSLLVTETQIGLIELTNTTNCLRQSSHSDKRSRYKVLQQVQEETTINTQRALIRAYACSLRSEARCSLSECNERSFDYSKGTFQRNGINNKGWPKADREGVRSGIETEKFVFPFPRDSSKGIPFLVGGHIHPSP